MAKAVGFLIRAQHSDGLWRDFVTFAGESDEWVTAYVATALAGVDSAAARESTRKAWYAMSKRARRAGGWGYNKESPADADSTAWALRMASALGKSNLASVVRGKRLLTAQQRRDGGIATCSSQVWGACFARMSSSARWSGWCDSHSCVTAASADALDAKERRNALAFLRKRQEVRGRWIGYWWADHEYPTTLALDALKRLGRSSDEARVRKALRWIASRIDSSGAVRSGVTGEASAFSTACALGVLAQNSRWHPSSAARKCLKWLIDHQRRDGSWASSATLRLPFPEDLEPESVEDWPLGDGFGDICLDHRSVFTTACVVGALTDYDSQRKP
jgi:squalene cyclase